jgi:hypothetical protein
MAAQNSVTSRLAFAAVSTLALLAGCGDSADEFAPPCPRPVILRDAGDLQRFRGNGRDFLDTALQGRITSISGSCKAGGPGAVAATVSVGMELTRGPAAVGRTTDVAFFVAVSRGQRVLDKQVYTVHAEFPENTDRLRLSGDSVDLVLPVSKQVGADAYQVTVGFQLAPEELEFNRQRNTRK